MLEERERTGPYTTSRGIELPELLSELAQAPDLAGAAGVLLECLTEMVGAARGALFVVEPTSQRLELRHAVGWAPNVSYCGAVSLEDDAHPIAVTAKLHRVVRFDHGAPVGLPFSCGVLLPVPEARLRNGAPPAEGSVSVTAERHHGWCILPCPSGERWRHDGHVPFAVLAVEGKLGDAAIDALATAAGLAGPVMARVHAADRLRRSAERLDEQRDLLTAIIDALPDPIVITDGFNRAIVQNRRAELLFSAREDDSEGRRRAVEINNLLFSSFLSKAALAGGVDSTARELNLVDPDEGTDLLFEVLVRTLPASVLRGGASVSVLRDVTDLKRASIELERQFNRARVSEMEATRERDRLNVILKNVGDPILVTDDQAKIILMNPQAEQLFEAPVGSSEHQQLQRVQGNDTKFTAFVADFALSPATLRRERITLVHPATGHELPVEVVAGKVANERGEPVAIVSVLHDLTKQVENERLYQELKTLNRELEDRIRLATADLEAQNLRLQWQSSELEKAYRLKSEFLANMSHELRTPINALIGYTALMLDRIYGELTEEQVEGLRRIRASSQHLLALINDILDLSKIEAGKMPVHLEPARVQPILLEVAAQIEPLVHRKSLEFRLDIDERIPVLYTDPTKIRQIVLNLLSNAVKFTTRGRVSLSAAVRGAELVIRVSDTGIGIRPQHLDVIFEEFRQVDQSRTREYGGTGLGLSITRKLVGLLEGRIAVESEYGSGATFEVALPLKPAEPSDDGALERSGGERRPS